MLVFFALLFPGSISALEQYNKNFSFELNNITVKEVLRYIEKNSEYVFLYSSGKNLSGKVSISAKDKNVNQILDEVLANTGLTYEIDGKQILLKEKPKTVNSSSKSKKVKNVSGVVTDESGEAIIGASVWVKNTAKGVITDLDGHYELNVDEPYAVLSFSYLGMKTQEIAVSDKSVINVTLAADAEQLEEVVVVGYGSQKKASVIGSISTVKTSNLKVPGASISNVLAGQLAGVVSMSRSGEPGRGSAADFYIRGVASFAGENKPLVLVDGIERDLDLVDVEDISSFSILKDAAASAVYGVRGANGVILITTKKGSEGKPVINARVESGFTQPTKMPKFAASPEWAELYNEMKGYAVYSPEEIQMFRDGSDPDLYPNVNWMDELYKNMASNQRVNLNISGGGDIARYFVSGSIYNEGSIFRNAGNMYDYNTSLHYNKYSFRANIDLNLTKSTVLNINLSNIYEKTQGPGADRNEIWRRAFEAAPGVYPKVYSDGTLSSTSIADGGKNPWNLLVHSGYSEEYWNSAQSLIGLNQDLGELVTEGLTASVKFSWDAANGSSVKREKTANQYFAKGRDEEGNLIFGNPIVIGKDELGFNESGLNGSFVTTYLEASVNYNRLFGDKHRVGGMFMYNHKIMNKKFSYDKYQSLPYKNQGLAGRVTYAFKDTYFAEFNAGYNGSENFARGHRFGFFPAYAIGWMVSNEKFWEPILPVVNELKLKASYGSVGNDAIGGDRWIYQSTIAENAGWHYGENGSEGGGGRQVGNVENLNVSWETAKKLNVGFELGMFDCVKLQADYFHEKRSGVFISRQGLPAIVGMTTMPKVNIGESVNRGVDATFEFEKKLGQVFMTARANFTYSRNKLLNNDEVEKLYKYQSAIGKTFGSSGTHEFGLIAEGLFQSQEEIDNAPVQNFGTYRVGDVRYRDVNGDGVVDSYDRVALGYTNIPEIVYGFGVTLAWKGFDVNAFFQGVGHTSFHIGEMAMRPFSSGNLNESAINADIYDHVWKTTNTPEQNMRAYYPRLSEAGGEGSQNNNQISTLTLRNGSFMRLKNFEIGYTMPGKLMEKTFVKSMRFYLSGSNLFTISKFKLWDPETGSADGRIYPPLRVITIGLTVKI